MWERRFEEENRGKSKDAFLAADYRRLWSKLEYSRTECSSLIYFLSILYLTTSLLHLFSTETPKGKLQFFSKLILWQHGIHFSLSFSFSYGCIIWIIFFGKDILTYRNLWICFNRCLYLLNLRYFLLNSYECCTTIILKVLKIVSQLHYNSMVILNN